MSVKLAVTGSVVAGLLAVGGTAAVVAWGQSAPARTVQFVAPVDSTPTATVAPVVVTTTEAPAPVESTTTAAPVVAPTSEAPVAAPVQSPAPAPVKTPSEWSTSTWNKQHAATKPPGGWSTVPGTYPDGTPVLRDANGNIIPFAP